MFFFIPIDIVKKIYDNDGIRNKLDAWLIFLSSDDPDVIAQLIADYPEFYTLYEEIYNLCQNIERVMNMFSKELLELDRNTVQYMIDEMQDEIDAQKLRIEEQDTKLEEQAIIIAKLQEQLGEYQK